MSDKIKFAVVGAGHIGKRHATMVQRNEDCELVGICDVRQELKGEIESTFGVPFFNSIEDMLAAVPEADVVNICTPNHLHAPQAIEALKQKHHVVIEKPMGLSKAECEKVIFTALQSHKLVFCVMQNRYSPPSEWLKTLLDSGKLGQIHMVQINCFWNRDERYYLPQGQPHPWKGKMETDGGTLFTQFSHFLDIMYWLFGDITNIKARLKDFNHQDLTEFEDSGVVSFEFENGGLGTINYSTAVYDQNLESSLTIVAENGSVKVGGQYMNEVEVCNVKDYKMPQLAEASPANDYGSYKGSAANHHFVIENVVATIKGDKVATTNALEGLKVVEIIENIYNSVKQPATV